MKIYTVYYRLNDSTQVEGIEVHAEHSAQAITEAFEYIEVMEHLKPEEVDICHVQVTE